MGTFDDSKEAKVLRALSRHADGVSSSVLIVGIGISQSELDAMVVAGLIECREGMGFLASHPLSGGVQNDLYKLTDAGERKMILGE